MCQSGGTNIFDRYRKAADAGTPVDLWGNPVAPKSTDPRIDPTDPAGAIDILKKKHAAEQVAEKQAMTKQVTPGPTMGARIEGNPTGAIVGPVNPAQGLFGTISKMLGIPIGKPSSVVNDPSRAVQAGRIGHSYGSADLRIGY